MNDKINTLPATNITEKSVTFNVELSNIEEIERVTRNATPSTNPVASRDFSLEFQAKKNITFKSARVRFVEDTTYVIRLLKRGSQTNYSDAIEIASQTFISPTSDRLFFDTTFVCEKGETYLLQQAEPRFNFFFSGFPLPFEGKDFLFNRSVRIPPVGFFDTLSAWCGLYSIDYKINDTEDLLVTFEYSRDSESLVSLTRKQAENGIQSASVQLPYSNELHQYYAKLFDGEVLIADETNSGIETFNLSPVIFINSIEDLNNIRSDLTGHYVLARHLDFEDNNSYDDPLNKSIYTTGSGWNSIGDTTFKFSGVFDGNGFTIKNLFINRGIFQGFMAWNLGEILNVGFVDVNIKGSSSVGGIVARNEGSIKNCFVTGNIEGTSTVGGIVGQNVGDSTFSWDAIIENCYAKCNVKADSQVGGLIGQFTEVSAIAKNCYSTGKVDSIGSFVGGFVGRVHSRADPSQIENCFWDTETSEILIDVAATGKTTDEMKNTETFENATWDIINEKLYEEPVEPFEEVDENHIFTNNWKIIKDWTYPMLGYENYDSFYPVRNFEELDEIRLKLEAEHHILNNIDASISASIPGTWVPIGNSAGASVILRQEADFKGIIRGNNFIIDGLVCQGQGIFSSFLGSCSGPKVDNLTLTNITINAGAADNIGAFFGSLRHSDNLEPGEIINCHIKNGYIRGRRRVGGFGGETIANQNHIITNCSFSGEIIGVNTLNTGDLGGFIGRINDGKILNCHTNAIIEIQRVAFGAVGGFSGSIGALVSGFGNEIKYCSAITVFKGVGNSYGGFSSSIYVTFAANVFNNNYSFFKNKGTNNPTISGFANSLIVWNNSIIRNCYCVMEDLMGSTNTNGFVNSVSFTGIQSRIVDCFFDKEVSNIESDNFARGKTTIEMKQIETYEDFEEFEWDMSKTFSNEITEWTILQDKDYPRFSWQIDTIEGNELKTYTADLKRKIDNDDDWYKFAEMVGLMIEDNTLKLIVSESEGYRISEPLNLSQLIFLKNSLIIWEGVNLNKIKIYTIIKEGTVSIDSFETDFNNWVIHEAFDNTPERTDDWSSDGIYSLRLNSFSGLDGGFSTVKKVINSDTIIIDYRIERSGRIQVLQDDVLIYEDDHGDIPGNFNNKEVYNKIINITPNTEIKIRAVADTSNSVYVFVDNIRYANVDTPSRNDINWVEALNNTAIPSVVPGEQSIFKYYFTKIEMVDEE